MAEVRPFRVQIPQAEIDDLRDRVARTRLAAPAPGDSWDYGTTEAYLTDMVSHWQDSFDWREQEQRMNEFPHFLTEIEGQTVHFVHVRSAEPNAVPLVLTHTYPGSFVDFLDMIGPLTDPVSHGGRAEDAFHVVVPSIPGFGFSTPLVDGGWTMKRVARFWDVLMRRLGYDSYGAHGSDTGANVSRELAILDPEGFLGWFQQRAGFAAANGSRPQTVAAGLADSPVAQLAWSELFENFGSGTSLVTRDQVLTQVSLYWLTNTGASAARFYYEEARAGQQPVVNEGRIGVAVFADDFQTIRPFAERDNTNLVHWSEFDTGGHFASMEVPELVTADLRAFFGS
jgi:pimeloyl-ACP methyl ester carboxylesterase